MPPYDHDVMSSPHKH